MEVKTDLPPRESQIYRGTARDMEEQAHHPGIVRPMGVQTWVWKYRLFYKVFQLPRDPPPSLCRLARPAGWGFEYSANGHKSTVLCIYIVIDRETRHARHKQHRNRIGSLNRSATQGGTNKQTRHPGTDRPTEVKTGIWRQRQTPTQVQPDVRCTARDMES